VLLQSLSSFPSSLPRVSRFSHRFFAPFHRFLTFIFIPVDIVDDTDDDVDASPRPYLVILFTSFRDAMAEQPPPKTQEDSSTQSSPSGQLITFNPTIMEASVQPSHAESSTGQELVRAAE
jgi:hypothetical protein